MTPEPMIANVTVDRTEEGAILIRWEAAGNDLGVSVFAGDSPSAIDRTRPAARVDGPAEAEIKGLDPKVRYYFEVAPEGGVPVMTAERRAPLEGTVNLRDLGGYETTDGRRVKWGLIFRSDSLARLTGGGLESLKRMGLKLVCDFRTPEEVEKGADRLPEDGSIEYLPLPVVYGEFDPAAAMASLQKGDISWLTLDFIIGRYIKKLDLFPQIWGRVVNRLAEPESRPLLFHCTGGKDRAGACAALILLALGVPEETVIYDHGLSNVYIAPVLERIYKQIRSVGVEPEKVEPYFTAPREAITAMVEHLGRTYGSAAEYLEKHSGVSAKTLARLKEELLE